jgi:tRNA(Ile2) C34 agmatinyltransferase TiaS
MGRLAQACPLCYSLNTTAKGEEPKAYRCKKCGAGWRWNGKTGGPVITKGIYQGKPSKLKEEVKI